MKETGSNSCPTISGGLWLTVSHTLPLDRPFLRYNLGTLLTVSRGGGFSFPNDVIRATLPFITSNASMTYKMSNTYFKNSKSVSNETFYYLILFWISAITSDSFYKLHSFYSLIPFQPILKWAGNSGTLWPLRCGYVILKIQDTVKGSNS